MKALLAKITANIVENILLWTFWLTLMPLSMQK